MTMPWVLLRDAVEGIASSLRRLAPRNDTAGDDAKGRNREKRVIPNAQGVRKWFQRTLGVLRVGAFPLKTYVKKLFSIPDQTQQKAFKVPEVTIFGRGGWRCARV